MEVTQETIAQINREADAIASDPSLGDGYERAAAIFDIQEPIMDEIDHTEIPEGMDAVVIALDEDFVGVTDNGCVVALGREREIAGTEQTWQELVLITAGQ